jgi:5-methylcytosine-specific restriction protein B
MARNTEHDSSGIFKAATEWRDGCLIGGKSLLWSEHSIWTEANLAQFKKHFVDRPDTAKDKNFDQKFREQLAKADDDVTRLACELLFVYFLFPSSVGRPRKAGLIREVADWKGIRIEEQQPLFSCFDHGIGDPGLVYNTGRPRS